MDLFSKCGRFTRVTEAKSAGLYPYFHATESRQGVRVMMEGAPRIMLGSNNYLGLTNHAEVVEASIEAVERFGTGCSGSRFLNGTLSLHLELEREIADFVSMEDCIAFSTGYQSNLGIISALCGRGDYVMCDRENHASIYDACRLSGAQLVRYRHNDMDSLRKRLDRVPDDAGILIVTDGVFSMAGDVCDLPGIVGLAREHGARVMVDDSHGIGVLGRNGAGTAEHFGLESEVDIVMGTFSKSLASLGGFMAGSAEVVDFVRHNSRPFIFSASIPPGATAAALAALRVLRREPERVRRLEHLSSHLREGLSAREIETRVSSTQIVTPIIPLWTSTTELTLLLAKLLYDAGVYVNPVLPPATPASDCLLRVSLMATHDEPILDEAMDIVARVFDEAMRFVAAFDTTGGEPPAQGPGPRSVAGKQRVPRQPEPTDRDGAARVEAETVFAKQVV